MRRNPVFEWGMVVQNADGSAWLAGPYPTRADAQAHRAAHPDWPADALRVVKVWDYRLFGRKLRDAR